MGFLERYCSPLGNATDLCTRQTNIKNNVLHQISSWEIVISHFTMNFRDFS
jgi:hypothetical protein